MKTREINLTTTSKAFHWHNGTMEFRTDGGIFILTKQEIEKLARYFKDVSQGFEYLYEPGRPS